MLNKIKIMLIAMVFLFPTFVFAEGDNKTRFTLEEKEASIGEEVSVKLNIENNSGFGVLTLRVEFDQDSLEYVSSELYNIKGAMLKGAELDKNGKVVLYALSISDLIENNGDILTIKFRVKDNAKENNELKINVENYGVDENTELDYATFDGVIRVNNVIQIEKNENKVIQSNLPEDAKDKKIIWKSSDESVATVDETGKVEFKKDGSVKITATMTQGDSEDSSEKVVYEKEYQVESKKEEKESKNNAIIFVVLGGILVILAVGFVVFKKKISK